VAEAHLRVIDGAGEVTLGDVVPDDYALLEEANRKLRREVAAYKAQLSRLRKVDPQAATVERLMHYWRDKLRGPTSRVQLPIDGKRADAVRKMLRQLVENDDDPELANPKAAEHAEATVRAEARAVERIMAAIDGCARFPFERYGEHFAESAAGRKRRDELAYILANEVRMEKLADLIEADERRIAYAAELWRMVQSQPNLKLVLASFGPEPHGEILARLVRWCCANPG
jgi:hypothetical protein